MTEPPEGGGHGPSGETPEGSPHDPGSPDYAGSPDDGPRRGAHRAGARPTPPPPPPAGAPYWPTPPAAPPGAKLRQPLADTLPVRLLQLGGALLLVIVLVVVLYALFHSNNKGENNQGAGSTAAKHTTAPATPGGRPSSGPATTTAGTATTAPATTSAAATSTKGATSKPPAGKPTSKPTAKPTTKPPTKAPTTKPTTAAPPPADVKAPLLVLNNSRIHGLAITGAATFRKGGWTVVGTGNFSGRLPRTTVFYSPGAKAAAETLARQFPTVTAVEPRPAGLRGDAPLIVVLTRYFKP